MCAFSKKTTIEVNKDDITLHFNAKKLHYNSFVLGRVFTLFYWLNKKDGQVQIKCNVIIFWHYCPPQ